MKQPAEGTHRQNEFLIYAFSNGFFTPSHHVSRTGHSLVIVRDGVPLCVCMKNLVYVYLSVFPPEWAPFFSLYEMTQVYDCVTVFTACAFRAPPFLLFILLPGPPDRTGTTSVTSIFKLPLVGSIHKPSSRSNLSILFYDFTAAAARARPCVRMCFVSMGVYVNS